MKTEIVDAYLDVQPGDVVLTYGGAVKEVASKLQHVVSCTATLRFTDGTDHYKAERIERLDLPSADLWKSTRIT